MGRVSTLLVWVFVAGLCAGCDNKTAVEHLQSAQERIAAGEPRVAVIELKNAIQKDPKLGTARALLGILHFQSGDMPSALKELQRAIDLGVEDDDTQIALLNTKNAMGRHSEVLGALEERDNLSGRYAVVLANAYLIGGDIARAKPLMQQGLHLPDGLYGMARIAHLENDTDAAFSFVEQLLSKDPKHRDGWLFKGEMALGQSDAETALEAFGQGRTLRGGDVVGQLGVIRAHLLLDDLQAAQTEVDALLKRASEFPPAQYLKGLISFKQQDLEAAEAALRVVQQFSRDHLPTLYLMGAVKAQQGQLNQAQDNLRRYLAADPSNVSVRKLLASIYNQESKFEEVLEVLQPVAQANSDPQAWAMLGAAQLRLGQMAEATEAFQQAVNLAPDMAPFRNQLALSLLSAGEDEQAVAQLSSAVELDSDQFQSDYILVMLKLRERDFSGAAEAVDQLIAKSADVPIGYNIKGAIAMAQEDLVTATQAFEKALEIDPSYFPAAQNLARIAEGQGDVAQARKWLDQVQQAEPESEPAALALIDLTVRSGDVEEGLRLLAEAVQKFPNSVRARLGQLRLLVATGALADAERAAKAALEVGPEVPDLLLLKADIDLRTGDRNEAQQSAQKLQTLMDQFQSNPVMLAAVGTLHLRLGNLSLARNNLEAAAASGQMPTTGTVSLARLELADGDHAAAQKRIDELTGQGASSEEIELLQADVFIAAGQIAKAQATFESLAGQGSRAATSRLALLLAQQGEHAKAQNLLDEWLTTNPNDRGMQVLLANAHIQAGRQGAAKNQYEAMLPTNDPVVLNNLAWIYMGEADPRALDMARQANQAAPNNPDIEDTLGWILVEQGDVAEGLEYLRASARARPDNASVQYHLGAAYAKSGDTQAAKDTLQRALAIGRFPESEAAQKLLNEI